MKTTLRKALRRSAFRKTRRMSDTVCYYNAFKKVCSWSSWRSASFLALVGTKKRRFWKSAGSTYIILVGILWNKLVAAWLLPKELNFLFVNLHMPFREMLFEEIEAVKDNMLNELEVISSLSSYEKSLVEWIKPWHTCVAKDTKYF